MDKPLVCRNVSWCRQACCSAITAVAVDRADVESSPAHQPLGSRCLRRRSATCSNASSAASGFESGSDTPRFLRKNLRKIQSPVGFHRIITGPPAGFVHGLPTPREFSRSCDVDPSASRQWIDLKMRPATSEGGQNTAKTAARGGANLNTLEEILNRLTRCRRRG